MFLDTNLDGRITTLFLERLNREVTSIQTDLLETGILDSLAFVELIYHVEQEFGVQVSVDDLEIDNFRSIAKIAEFISQRLGTS